MSVSNRLPDGIIRRWVDLQNRVAYFEDRLGPGSATAEKAVRALIDFEEDAGDALAAALRASPVRSVRTRVKEEDF
ncbi:MAG: hypothetical protein OXG44_01545 [Gammaproteobacteria bacterium]|nr:hypothetical protein [Gammaproteobacteria bacterium]